MVRYATLRERFANANAPYTRPNLTIQVSQMTNDNKFIADIL
jgi:hypothetical protein